MRWLILMMLVLRMPLAAAELNARIGDDHATLSLEICDAQANAALKLYASASAQRFVLHVQLPEGATLRQRGEEIRISPWPGGCVRIEIDLKAIADAQTMDVGYRLGDVLLVSAEQWLWRPNRPSQLRMALPPGWSISAPWASCGSACFNLSASSADGPALVALGALDTLSLGLKGGKLEATLLPTFTPDERVRAVRLVESLPKLLDAAYGRLPVPHLQVLLVPMRKQREAIPWGQVYRGGLGGIHFFIDPEREWAEFASNWVIAHELTHLLHPYLGTDARWLSEGLASYQQQALRARAGQISESEAWRGLLKGFARGQAARSRLSLRSASADMHQQRAYMTVYWGGAAYWLDVETQLLASKNLRLMDVLERFSRCCLPETQAWNDRSFLKKLDELAETTLFSETAARYRDRIGFPETAAQLSALGVSIKGERVRFDPNAPQAALRARIMGKKG